MKEAPHLSRNSHKLPDVSRRIFHSKWKIHQSLMPNEHPDLVRTLPPLSKFQRSFKLCYKNFTFNPSPPAPLPIGISSYSPWAGCRSFQEQNILLLKNWFENFLQRILPLSDTVANLLACTVKQMD